ncbi:MAG: hypothetical protein JOZ54_18090 [Acidobacteria bacterium]|nr:hypothetical protein [Acidobacteriota bacterium]
MKSWLVFAMVIGPLAALGNLTISDALAPTACEQGSMLLLHVCAAVSLLLALTGSVIGRRAVVTQTDMLARDPAHWMAVAAFYLSLGSAMAIIAMEIPNWILRSCD